MFLPSALAVAYFGFMASDQFYATADYAIRFSQGSHSASGAGQGGGLLGGGAAAGAAASMSDMYILRDYILSHQILQDLQPDLDIRSIYSNPQADRLVRLNPDVSEEQLLEYWKGMVSLRCDISTGITHLGVRAFTPGDAKQVADDILKLSEALVNRLSDRAQSDRVGLAKADVDEAYARVTQALDALRVYQQGAKQVSPESFVLARSELEARIEREVSQYETQIERLSRELPDDAPGIKQLRKRLDIAQKQLEAERQRSTASASTQGTMASASEIFTEFSKLKLESEFAAKAYDSALSSLEQARLEAAKQDRYLEAFVRPQLPDAPTYPKRLFNIILVTVGAFLVWSIGGLMIAAIREHL
jgi:capsular polysaccharide transport system permease protein